MFIIFLDSAILTEVRQNLKGVLICISVIAQEHLHFLIFLTHCLGYFSFDVTKQHSQGSLKKNRVIWSFLFHPIRVHIVRGRIQGDGRQCNWSWKIWLMYQTMRIEWLLTKGIWHLKPQSMPPVSPPFSRPHLQKAFQTVPSTWD